jgi:hypothetical protein
MRIAIGAIICLALAAPLWADPNTDLERTLARWHSQRVTGYSFTYQDQDVDLVSPRCGGALIRIRVVPARVIPLIVVRGTSACPTGTRGKSIDVQLPASIEDLFSRIHRWAYNPPTKVEITATYDLEYGVPLRWSPETRLLKLFASYPRSGLGLWAILSILPVGLFLLWG